MPFRLVTWSHMKSFSRSIRGSLRNVFHIGNRGSRRNVFQIGNAAPPNGENVYGCGRWRFHYVIISTSRGAPNVGKMEVTWSLEFPQTAPTSICGPSWTLSGGQGRPMRVEELESPKSHPQESEERPRGSKIESRTGSERVREISKTLAPKAAPTKKNSETSRTSESDVKVIDCSVSGLCARNPAMDAKTKPE